MRREGGDKTRHVPAPLVAVQKGVESAVIDVALSRVFAQAAEGR